MDMGGGRLIRVLIVALTLIVIWKIWEFSSLAPAAGPHTLVEGGRDGGESHNLPPPQPVQQVEEDNRLLKEELNVERTNVAILKNELLEVRKKMVEKNKEGTYLKIRAETSENMHNKTMLELRNIQIHYENSLQMNQNLRDEIEQFNVVSVKSQKYTKLLERKVDELLSKYEPMDDANMEYMDDQEVPVSPLLRVEVYYEALCPDSRSFVMKQLLPAYTVLSEILDVHMVPYGKATTSKDSSGRIGFSCQHGPTECEANKVHACVSNRIKDKDKVLNIINCMIDRNSNPLKIGQFCVEKFGEAWSDVEKCMKSEKGDLILKHMGELTHSLKPSVSFIPTITIDGSQEEQRLILRSFQKVLCSRYKGEKPDNCP